MSSNYPPPNYTPNYPPAVPPPATTVKKSSPWIWVLAGCGTLLVLSIIAVAGLGFFAYRKAQQAGLDPELMQKNPGLAAAKIAITMNPDLELVTMDEENSTLTVRDKKSGKTVTLSAEDIQEGKISIRDEDNEKVSIQANGNSGTFEIKSDKGTVKLGSGAASDMPSWLPTYPGVEVTGTASMQSNEGATGSYQFTTADAVEDVLAYYENALENAGLEVETTSSKANGKVNGGTATGKDADETRTVAVMAANTGGETTVTVTYQDKK